MTNSSPKIQRKNHNIQAGTAHSNAPGHRDVGDHVRIADLVGTTGGAEQREKKSQEAGDVLPTVELTEITIILPDRAWCGSKHDA